MKPLWQLVLAGFLLIIPCLAAGQQKDPGDEPLRLQNPVTATYLKAHLTKTSPRLILTPPIENELKHNLKTDPLLQRYYQYLQREAGRIMQEPLLKRELEGFRLLAVSRQMVERMSTLCMVYRLERMPEMLARINAELQTVCAFSDWNPQHFLDVAEMSFAVALAIDWVGEYLPGETVILAQSALIEKGILPSYKTDGPRMFWINGVNNWNQVCHGGMVAASLAVADKDPELAARTISRALDKLPNALREYGPDGVYPEGPTYWGYGTAYTVIASSALTTALGTDFGIADYPGFMESADFRLLATAPSGEFFNFADSDGREGGMGSVLLAWFAARTGKAIYLDQSFFEEPEDAGRFAGPGLIWLAQFVERKTGSLPLEWVGRGPNPVAFFRGGDEDPGQYYLAVKGGSASISHGNMDAGSFVFELNGVRWVIDPGNQNYYALNRIGFNLAGLCQDCERWTLLTKKNQGHSTLTVNDARFKAAGYAPISDFKTGEQPQVTIDLTDILDDHLNSARRTFVKESNRSILITDRVEINEKTKYLTWTLMTVADVVFEKNGAVLKKDGEQLKISILSPANLQFSLVSLDPPPLEIDKRIEGLKRLEIRVPAWLFEEGKGLIQVRLSGE